MKSNRSQHFSLVLIYLCIARCTCAVLGYSDEFLITPAADPNGAISPNESFMAPYGSSVEFTAQAHTDHRVDRWFIYDQQVQVGGNSYTLPYVDRDYYVYVTFIRQEIYTFTPSAGPHGSISPDKPVKVEHGHQVTFYAEPNERYEVDMWYVDGIRTQVGGRTFMPFRTEDITVHVTFRPLLSYSLGVIDFNDGEDFQNRVTHNNEGSRIHVEHQEGEPLEPQGYLILHSLKDEDPNSSTYDEMLAARAKAEFSGTPADQILIRFRYLFTSALPGVMLKVYLSDVPILLDPDDPEYLDHYLYVVTIIPPLDGPGSPGSGSFAIFEQTVHTGSLDISRGLWVELELIEPAVSNSVAIDDWNTAVQCYGICLDINWDNFVDTADFLKVIGECGRPAEGEQACSEGVFSSDGMVDIEDLGSWDWALNDNASLLNLCSIPLVGHGATTMMSTWSKTLSVRLTNSSTMLSLSDPSTEQLGGLWIIGKRGTYQAQEKMMDRLYAFNEHGIFRDWSTPVPDRGNTRIIQDRSGALYLLNIEAGLLALEQPDKVVIPSGMFMLDDMNEPRYRKPATVYVGLQNQGSDVFGRPLLDVALAGDYAYVLPVVVDPDGEEPYLVAAKLRMQEGSAVPYEVVHVYDDPPLSGESQYRNALRELELDNQGNVYVLNAHRRNESDICWCYKPDGTFDRLELGQADSEHYCPAPMGMFISQAGTLYLASSLLNPADHDISIIKGFSTQESLTLKQTINIHSMQHIVSITEDVQTGNLLVVGFNMDNIPAYPNPFRAPFYSPVLAIVPPGIDTVRAQDLSDPDNHDLGLPLSAVMRMQ